MREVRFALSLSRHNPLLWFTVPLLWIAVDMSIPPAQTFTAAGSWGSTNEATSRATGTSAAPPPSRPSAPPMPPAAQGGMMSLAMAASGDDGTTTFSNPLLQGGGRGYAELWSAGGWDEESAGGWK